MLAYFLAIAIAITSIVLYLGAFFSPKIHRQDDFLWSGLGLFYGLILWICAARMTGAVLLGQIASVSIIAAFVWENRQLRKALVASGDGEKLAGFSFLNLILTLLGKLSPRLQQKTVPPQPPKAAEQPQPQPTTPEPETSESQEIEPEKIQPEAAVGEAAIEQQETAATAQTKEPTSVPSPPEETKTEIMETGGGETETAPSPAPEIGAAKEAEIESQVGEQQETTGKKGFFANLIATLTKPLGQKKTEKKTQESIDARGTAKSEVNFPEIETDEFEEDSVSEDNSTIQPEAIDGSQKEETQDLASAFTEGDKLEGEGQIDDISLELDWEGEISDTQGSAGEESQREIDLTLDARSQPHSTEIDPAVENLSIDDIPPEDRINALTDLLDGGRIDSEEQKHGSSGKLESEQG